MGPALDTSTSVTLIGRLQNPRTDEAAWSEFVDRYAPKIHAWCRKWTSNPADVEDVTQTVLLRLLQYLRSFRYNPDESFRGWLHTVTHNAWKSFCDSRSRAIPGSGDSAVQDQLESLQAREDLVQKLEEAFDLELLEEASARVRLRVKPERWQAYQLLDVELLSGAEVAARLGMQVGAVYNACCVVRGMLKEEIQRLENPDPNSRATS
jgi:RNA polymerase sigma-70 factor (ECF subfamily)